MKRAGTLLLALALTATGCVELPKWTETKPQPPAKESTLLVPTEPPVLPEQVNDGNAHQALDALRNELDRAANDPAPSMRPPGADSDR
jgi:hypothetical protein